MPSQPLHKSVLAALLLGWAALVVRFWWLCDDSFISFRYSRNLALGRGLRYNVGDHVPAEGYSNFLWVLLAAPADAVGGLTVIMPSLSALCGLALLLGIYNSLTERLQASQPAALLAVAFAALCPAFAVWSTSGLATMPLALCLFGLWDRVVLSDLRTTWKQAAIWALALLLIRTEGVAWASVILSLGAISQALRPSADRAWSHLARVAGVLAVGWALYSAFRLAWFGTLVSNTMLVKVGFDAQGAATGLQYIVQNLFAIPGLLLCWLAIAALPQERERWHHTVPLALMTVALPAYAVVIGGDYMAFSRLLVPGIAFASVTFGVAASRLTGQARQAALIAGVVGVAVSGLSAFNISWTSKSLRGDWTVRARKARTEYEQWAYMGNNVQLWGELGKALHGLGLGPTGRISTGRIGAKGFYSDLFLYDVGGLVTREVAEQPFKKKKTSPGHEKSVGPKFFFEQRPDIYQAALIKPKSVASQLKTWRVSPEEKEVYVPQLQPQEPSWDGVRRSLLWLRLAEPGENPAAMWEAFEGPPKAAKAPKKKRKKREKGRWHRVKRTDELTEKQAEQIAALQAIGYLSGEVAASALPVVESWDRDKALRGLNFYSSGHGPEAVLAKMDGTPLHRWRLDFWDIWPDYDGAKPSDRGVAYWRKAELLPDGSVLAIFEGFGIVKVDHDSNQVWALPNRAHHDLYVGTDGIWMLTRTARMAPEIHPKKPILEDFMTLVSHDGKTQRSFSLLEALQKSDYADIFTDSERKSGDLFHTNALVRIEGPAATKDGPWKEGNFLLSSRVLNTIFIVDPTKEEVVWAHQGPFKRQHDPTLQPDGSILIFDNVGAGGKSRVLQIDRVTGETTWSYQHSPKEPFLSKTCGTASRLANGNTLVAESGKGRAFEVTPEGERVWVFNSPHRAASDNTLVASLFEVIRLPPEPPAWVDSSTLE